jgi:hypothetical protein
MIDYQLSGPKGRHGAFKALPLLAKQSIDQDIAPVAQLDRALPSEGKGHRFDSCRVRQYI